MEPVIEEQRHGVSTGEALNDEVTVSGQHSDLLVVSDNSNSATLNASNVFEFSGFAESVASNAGSDCWSVVDGEPLTSRAEPDLTDFDPSLLFEQSWHRIGGNDMLQAWETGFWKEFFDPTVDPVDNLVDLTLKRSAEPVDEDISLLDSVVQAPPPKRKAIETFMHVVKQSNVEGWQDAATANWETAIRRWHSMVITRHSVAPSILAIKSKEGFREQAQILGFVLQQSPCYAFEEV